MNRLLNDEIDVLCTLSLAPGKVYRAVSVKINEEMFEKINSALLFFKKEPKAFSISFDLNNSPNVLYSTNLSDEHNEYLINFLHMKKIKTHTISFSKTIPEMILIIEKSSRNMVKQNPDLIRQKSISITKNIYDEVVLEIGSSRFNLNQWIIDNGLNKD